MSSKISFKTSLRWALGLLIASSTSDKNSTCCDERELIWLERSRFLRGSLAEVSWEYAYSICLYRNPKESPNLTPSAKLKLLFDCDGCGDVGCCCCGIVGICSQTDKLFVFSCFYSSFFNFLHSSVMQFLNCL